jgi:hypothetical protein
MFAPAPGRTADGAVDGVTLLGAAKPQFAVCVQEVVVVQTFRLASAKRQFLVSDDVHWFAKRCFCLSLR